MSNLYRGSFYYNKDTDARVIDSNEAMSLKLEEIRKSIKANKYSENTSDSDGFVVGINAENVETLISQDDENVEDVAKIVTKDIEYMLNNADMQAKGIIDKARYDAAMIIAEAKKEAEVLKSSAKDEGMSLGYNEGKDKGRNEIEALKQQLISQKKEMEDQYNELINNIEPVLVETILEVFSKITNVVSMDKKDIILNLVNSVMSGDDVGSNYIIRVSSEDVEFLRNNKDYISKMSRKDVHIEIVEDKTLKKNECLIDTDLGIFNASLDIQLEGLINDIKILSCMGKDI
ncbi:MAG: hypothetical protein J6L69_06405 [Lachnospiraceae bacterium]|nr:hypothetical protein [Lachnospiraceae bacterium]